MKKNISLADIPRGLVDFFFEIQPPPDLPFSIIVNKARNKHLSLYSRYTLICKSKIISNISLTEISAKYDILVKNINELLFISLQGDDEGLIKSIRELSDIVEEVGFSVWTHYYSLVYGGSKI